MGSDAIRMTVKAFFDKPAVMAKMDAARRRALSKAGAFVRRDARASIRKSKGISKPGSPPRSHEGSLKKFLLFSYDAATESVVVGPAKLSNGTGAPEILEFGGTRMLKKDVVMRVGKPGRDSRGRFVNSPRVTVKAGTTIRYAARPFMGPALEKNRTKIPEAFLNSVK
jgi:hypothetical protein